MNTDPKYPESFMTYTESHTVRKGVYTLHFDLDPKRVFVEATLCRGEYDYNLMVIEGRDNEYRVKLSRVSADTPMVSLLDPDNKGNIIDCIRTKNQLHKIEFVTDVNPDDYHVLNALYTLTLGLL